jgi:hypothetical protein
LALRRRAGTPRLVFPVRPGEVRRRLTAQLNRLAADIDAKLGELTARFGALALLCYERRVSGRECHRLTFGRWWVERTGEEVPELDGTNKP